MGEMSASDPAPANNETGVERTSDRETSVTRSFDAPVQIVFEAWSNAELFRQWWVPKSFGLSLLSCEMDVRVGGKYRLEFGHPGSNEPMAFFGTYLDVIPNNRIVWSNEESDEGSVTTVTFDEQGGRTILTVHDLYPAKEALDHEMASGGCAGMGETLAQLEALIAGLATGT